MEKRRIEEVDSRTEAATVFRPLTEAIGATDVTLNQFELAPGDSFAYGYHKHENQEELFVIQSGRVTFETEDGDVVVDDGEIIRFGPGEYQQGVNTGDERALALAIGAPQETGRTEIRRECEHCGGRTPTTVEVVEDGAAKITRCLDCGAVTGRFE